MAQVGFWVSIARSCWVSGPFQQQNKGREHRSPLSGKCNNRFAFFNLRIDDIKRPHPLRHRNKCHLVQLLPLNPPDAAAAANTWADDEQQKLSIIKAARQSQYLTPYQVYLQALLCPALTIVAAFPPLCASCWHSAPTGAAPAAQGVDDSDSPYQNVSQQRSALGLTHLVLSPHQTMALGSATQVLISSWHIQTQVSHSKKCSLVRVLSWAGSVNPLFQLGCVLLLSSEYLIRIWSMRTPCRLSEKSHKYIAQVVITGTRQYETCNFLFKKKN